MKSLQLQSHTKGWIVCTALTLQLPTLLWLSLMQQDNGLLTRGGGCHIEAVGSTRGEKQIATPSHRASLPVCSLMREPPQLLSQARDLSGNTFLTSTALRCAARREAPQGCDTRG